MRGSHVAITAALSFALCVVPLGGCSFTAGDGNADTTNSETNTSNTNQAEQVANPWVDCDTWDRGDFSFAITLTDGRDSGWMASTVAVIS